MNTYMLQQEWESAISKTQTSDAPSCHKFTTVRYQEKFDLKLNEMVVNDQFEEKINLSRKNSNGQRLIKYYNFRWSSAWSEYKRVRPSSHWRVQSTKWFLHHHLILTIWDGSSEFDHPIIYHHLGWTILFWSSELDHLVLIILFWSSELDHFVLIIWAGSSHSDHLNLIAWFRSTDFDPLSLVLRRWFLDALASLDLKLSVSEWVIYLS